MKALIFNSGLGSRLGKLTESNPKGMVRLGSGEAIFERQLRILYSCGVREFIITTGPWPEQIKESTRQFADKGCVFHFVNNPIYNKTNYIYSMYLAYDLLADDEFLVLHGDLVFDAAYVQKMIDAKISNLGSVNRKLPHSKKDFKARVVDGEVREVSVNIFDKDCITFQPFYKLSSRALGIWLRRVVEYVEHGKDGCYAENAANEVFEEMHVKAFSYEGHFVEEVDTLGDLKRVSEGIRAIDYSQQPVYIGSCRAFKLGEGAGVNGVADAKSLVGLFKAEEIRYPLIVAHGVFKCSGVKNLLDDVSVPYEQFDDFSSNPKVDEVIRGVRMFLDRNCDSLVSIGGGSAIDVAKCIKAGLSFGHQLSESSFGSKFTYNKLPHIAVPTTAGTGSESTHFAVLYIDGAKISVSQDCLLPDAAILDAAFLSSLSNYQRKCTFLDALCQAIESYWSVRSNEKSRSYSARAISMLMKNYSAYFLGDESVAKEIIQGANYAGKAINITTTTAAHAMSYKLTSLYGIPHGYAVAVCLPSVWHFLIKTGNTKFDKTLKNIACLITGNSNSSREDGLLAFESLMDDLNLPFDWKPANTDELDILVESVDLQRLKNFPEPVTKQDLAEMYNSILR